MESTRIWFLLVIPATVAVMTYQYLVPPMTTQPGTLASLPTIKRFDTTPATSPAFGDPQPMRQVSASGDDGKHASLQKTRAGLTINTVDPAPLPTRRQRPAETLKHTETHTTTRQDSSTGMVVGVNPGARDPANSSSGELPESATPAASLNTDLVTILDENPYLPVADEDYADAGIVYDTAPQGCPQTLFRGGNAYAILRLSLMGCDVPGS